MVRILGGVIAALLFALVVLSRFYLSEVSETGALEVELQSAIDINESNGKVLNDFRAKIDRRDEVIARRNLVIGQLQADFHRVQSDIDEQASEADRDKLRDRMPRIVFDELREGIANANKNRIRDGPPVGDTGQPHPGP